MENLITDFAQSSCAIAIFLFFEDFLKTSSFPQDLTRSVTRTVYFW